MAGTKGPIYLWNGKASDSSLKKTAENLAKQLVEGASVEHVGEGGEPQPFWDILGDPQVSFSFDSSFFLSLSFRGLT